MKIETQAQLSRTVQALVETDGLIAKERRYRDDLQKADYLASLTRHADKLSGMIREYHGRGAMKAYGNPRMSAVIENWPHGNQRVTAESDARYPALLALFRTNAPGGGQ